jgi:hypothetical protein
MSPTQEETFNAASGFHAASLSFDIKLLVGGVVLVSALFILGGLMQLLNSNSAWDKHVFLISLLGLSFVVMLLFLFIA